MTNETGPQTKAELRTALHTLVETAFLNGVTVDNGGYALRHDDPEIPDWEVHITQTTKSSSYHE